MSNKTIYILCTAILILSVIIEVLFVHHHVHYWWHALIGFDVAYGFIGCIVIIIVSKALGKAFIQRDEQYYGGGDEIDD